jgi:hypothetical protein
MDAFSEAVATRVDGLLGSKVAKGVAEDAGMRPQELSYYRKAVRPIPLRVLPALADTLGVRVSWLLTGVGRMRRTVEVFEGRALYEVDGLREDWDRPSTPIEDYDAEKTFMKSFRRHDGGKYADLPEVVRLLFTNLMARVFARLHEAPHATSGHAWRGEVAGLELGRVMDAAPGAGFNRHPESTRKWIQAMGEEMEHWETEVPSDFQPPMAAERMPKEL